MSRSLCVVGFKAPDDKWYKMKAIYDACQAAGIDCPSEVEKYFDYRQPDPTGVEVSLAKSDAISNWGDDCRSGYQIEIAKLPKDLTHIRFYNS